MTIDEIEKITFQSSLSSPLNGSELEKLWLIMIRNLDAIKRAVLEICSLKKSRSAVVVVILVLSTSIVVCVLPVAWRSLVVVEQLRANDILR